MRRLVVVLALVSSGALAQSRFVGASLDSGTRNRHFGFFLRLDPGVGFLAASESTAAGPVRISGGAGSLGLSLGGALSEDNILGVRLYDATAVNPRVTVNGGGGTAWNTTLTVIGAGPMFTHYFMPANAYVSASAAITSVSLETSGSTGNTKPGFGAQVSSGKEWWVSDHWGLGVSGAIGLSWNPTDATGTSSTTMRTATFSVAFSATYN